MEKQLYNEEHLKVIIDRLCYQLTENHGAFEDSVIIGLQPRGVYLARRIQKRLQVILKKKLVVCGDLDITFYRDDFRTKELIPNKTNIDFIIEDKKVILVDDVLYTGRTIRSGLDAILAFGRPKSVELLVLIDRRFSRDLPIQATYVGQTIDSISSQKVKVLWKEVDKIDCVTLIEK